MSLLFLGVWPKSTTGWLCVLAVGPIAFFVLLAVSELIGAVIGAVPGIRHADRAIERRTLGEAVSGTRVAYLFVRFLILLVPVLLLAWWLENRVTPVGALRTWWLQHLN